MELPLTKAHGLDGALVEPDWPPLTLPEIQALLTNFPEASPPIAILSASPRPFSAAGIVETLRGRIFVKRHAGAVRDVDSLNEEHQFIRHLSAHDVCVPKILETASGASAIQICDWTYEVHHISKGIDLYTDATAWTPFQSVKHAHSAGGLLARMHLAAHSYDAPARNIHPLISSFTIFAAQNPTEALDRYLRDRSPLDRNVNTRLDCAEALLLLTPFHNELKPWLTSLPALWTHNDLHASNLFWSSAGRDAQAVATIDFGLADRTNAVYDIAQAIERNIVEWLTLMRDPGAGNHVCVHLDQMWAFLHGYEEVRPLKTAEAAALAPMLALCHAEFALTEAQYFLSVLNSPEKAYVATHDYLVNHAKWFHGPGQPNILDPLRRWAAMRKFGAVGS
jgi:Ser/Thr protein kinase RdoA (MazF antagonist)